MLGLHHQTGFPCGSNMRKPQCAFRLTQASRYTELLCTGASLLCAPLAKHSLIASHAGLPLACTSHQLMRGCLCTLYHSLCKKHWTSCHPTRTMLCYMTRCLLADRAYFAFFCSTGAYAGEFTRPFHHPTEPRRGENRAQTAQHRQQERHNSLSGTGSGAESWCFLVHIGAIEGVIGRSCDWSGAAWASPIVTSGASRGHWLDCSTSSCTPTACRFYFMMGTHPFIRRILRMCTRKRPAWLPREATIMCGCGE